MHSEAEQGEGALESWEAFSRTRDPQLRAELIERYMRLARIGAAKLYGLRTDLGASFDDYLQYARVGLIEAVDRFDVQRRVPFESYAMHRIRGAVLNGLVEQSEAAAQREFWRTRMPERMSSLVQGAGIAAPRASLQQLADLTVGIAVGLLLDGHSSEPVDDSAQANPYAATELRQFAERARALVDRLPQREALILRGHYFEQLEFQELARQLSITKGRVSQLHSRALQRLREMLGETRIDRKL